ncbi:MAG: FtsH protease activity modulator HflK [Acidobacteriota bacterium]
MSRKPFDPADVIDIRAPRKGRGAIPIVVAVALLVVWLGTSTYSVGTDEQAVVLRFGRHERIVGPGLHLKAPAPIERAMKVATDHVFKLEFGFRTKSAGVKTEYASGSWLDESLMLTGDLNLVNVQWIVQYKVKDPVQYLFRVRNVDDTIRYGAEAVTRKAVGDRSFDEVTTAGDQIAPEVQKELQVLFDEYQMGVDVQLVKMQDIEPPAQVKDSFNAVNNALQERETLVNQARESYNQAVPAERGRAAATVTAAEGYAIDRVNRAKGDADRFLQLVAEHRKAPGVTEQRLYLETMRDVIPKIPKVYIVEGAGKTVLPLLPWSEPGAAGKP